MGWLLRATVGFAIAFALYAPATFVSYLDALPLRAVRADLAAAHPQGKLAAMLEPEKERSQSPEGN